MIGELLGDLAGAAAADLSSVSFGRIAVLGFDKAGFSIADPGKEFRDLRVAFEIEKTAESTPNKARIDIYNLRRESRAKLQEPDTAVVLKVGYRGIAPAGVGSSERGPIDDASLSDDKLTMIFTGDGLAAAVRRSGPDIITTLLAGDGQKAVTETHVEKAYAPGTSLKSVVGDLADALKLTVGELSGIPDKSFAGGLSISGLASSSLDTLLAPHQMEWSVQDGVFNALPKAQTTKQQGVKLSAATGLLSAEKREKGRLELRCLLNPKILPMMAVEVDALGISGTFQARRVVHSGDTHGSDWFTTIEASAPEGAGGALGGLGL